MQPTEYYAIQPAFTGGEISADVASRVDIEKYQLSLLRAENANIRPYGAVRKRPGLLYCGTTKGNGRARLYKFRFTASLSYLLEFGAGYVRVWRGGRYLGVEIATPYTLDDLPNLRFVQSIDVLYICSGTHPVEKLMRYGDTSWALKEIDWLPPAFDDINANESIKIAPSAVSGTITLTATGDVFQAGHVGAWVKLEQEIGGTTVTCTGGVSAPIKVGTTWKIITHGTWTGTVTIQKSTDGGEWKQLRSYTAKDDTNPTESGSVEDYEMLRLVVSTTSGTCTADLSSYPYTHTGYAQITAVASATSATAVTRKESFGSTEATKDWYISAWNAANGFPCCATFFQDRLVLGGCTKHPQRIWMSRSGDYENFEVEKESGTVTDDSGITADLLSLQAFEIEHMTAGNDLLVFTEGNTWSISGAETVKPTSITPRNQENYGISGVTPLRIGARTVYVQRRGSIVRDVGYSYDTDSYGGTDLTLLAKHLIKGHEIKEADYAQEPDSTLYFVRDDGALLCLTYLMDQKVFGWSHIKTDGVVESVSAISDGNNDLVYLVVRREVNGQTVRYIERFDTDSGESDNQEDYCMMDAAVRYELQEAATNITGLEHLEGKTVRAIGDGYLFEPMKVTGGKIILPQASKEIVVGLPYTMILEQPNFDAGATETGTLQGRKKAVTNAILRLTNSYGGEVGPSGGNLLPIIYESGRLELGEPTLFSGDKRVNLPIGGFDTLGRVYIRHTEPYPFTLSAIIRAVTFGG